MSGTYSGSYNVAITLNSAHPAVTISGTVDATSLAGTYDVQSSAGAATDTIYTALFANLAGGFSIYNAGLIENPGGDPDNTLQTGIVLATTGTVTNAGTIRQTGTDASSSADSGLVLLQGGSLTNLAPGQISGLTGVLINGTHSSYIFNAGTLAGAQGAGLDVQSPGAVINNAAGTISSGASSAIALGLGGTLWNSGLAWGSTAGLYAGGDSWVVNAGTIAQTGTSAASGAGIYFGASGTLTNTTMAEVIGLTGVQLGGMLPSDVFNSGWLVGTQWSGINAQSANAFISNSAGGTIDSGLGTGIHFGGGGTLFNSGAIDGWLDAISASSTATVQNSGAISQLGTNTGNAFNAGIYLGNGGTLTNLFGGKITGFNGAFLNGNGNNYISNAGTLTGTGLAALYVRDASSSMIVNQSQGFMGGLTGIIGYYTALAIINHGDISGEDGDGIQLYVGGLVRNDGDINASGGADVFSEGNSYIYNGGDGSDASPAYPFAYMYSLHDCVEIVLQANGIATITNDGTMLSKNGDVLYVDGDGVVINGSAADRSALMYGGFDGGFFGTNGTITNFASIVSPTSRPGGAGLEILGTGMVTNFGFIAGYTGVALFGPNSTLFNAGTISGDLNFGAAVRFAGNFGELDLAPGAMFKGSVYGLSRPGAFTRLRLIDPPGPAGTLAGVGTQFKYFNEIDFDPGAQWLVSGDADGLATGQTIGGFAAGDTIELTGFSASSFSYVSSIGLELFNETGSETLDLTGSFTSDSFGVQANADGTAIALCYLRGTQILTPSGEVAVETLRAGDVVVTRDGGMQKLRWIGRQDYAGRFIARNPGKIPVCIHPGALGGNQPARPFWVSPGHALLLGGTLVVARNLVNGITVTQPAPAELVEYYAIELATHDCVMAQGAWAESYADGPGLRAQFHNAAAFYAAYPGYAEPADITLCAPRPLRGPALAAVLRPVVARAAAGVAPGALRGCIDLIGADGVVEGWAQDIANPYLPVLLEVMLGERVLGQVLACDFREDLAAAGIGNGQCMFSFAVPDGMTGELHVRRAADGAEVYGSEECRKKAVAF